MMLALAVAFVLGGSVPETLVLESGQDVWDLTIADMNGDAKLDLITFWADSRSYPLEKGLAVYLANADGGYAAQPSVELKLAPSIGTAFVAETDGVPPQELVVVDSSAAYVYRLNSDGFALVAESRFNSLYPTGATEPIFLPKSAEDLDGDGIDEWLVPVPNGYEIRNVDGLIAAVPASLESEIRKYGALAIQHRLPTIHCFDLPGSSQKGVAFLSDRFADFSYGPNWSKHYRYRIPLHLDEQWEAFTRMGDINGDGFPDLLITQTQGTISVKVQTQIYIADKPFSYPETPTMQFHRKGAFTTPMLLDVNQDDKADVVFLSNPISIRNILNYFLRKKISVQIDAYLFEDGRFSKKPTHRTQITTEAPEGRERVAYAMGDFTGDGQIDVAAGVGAQKLAVFKGDPETFLSSKPWKIISVPTFGVARSEDLDGNGAEDIVLFHPGGEHKRRIEVILF